MIRCQEREPDHYVLGSPLVGQRFEKIARRYRRAVNKAEAIENKIAVAEANEDDVVVRRLQGELKGLDSRVNRLRRKFATLRFQS